MYTSHPFCLLKLWQALVLICLFGAPSGVLARHDIAVKTTESFSTPPSDPCDNPVIINNITVQHTLCGISTGSISVSIEGGNAGCIFQWTPAVSTSATASQLAAGAYHLKITRQGNSACTADTTIIVNNDNGPAVDVVEVLPSNCLASNGKATLWPTSLFYVWDNGEIGAVNDGLLSICYYVTATEPGSGCYSVVKVCVPNENPLVTSAQIVHPAKCGKSNGIVQITVTGGSGQYSYSLGPGATLTGLAAGDYVCVVSDNNSGCTAEVSFAVPDAPVEATVNITPYNISCPGGGTGFVGFEVIPGDNFQLPYTFSIRDTNNVSFQPGNLMPGKYFLSIADADSCLLPVYTFFITQPPPIETQAQIVPETCEQGGQIQLDITGGNGGYRVDWLDLPGAVNTEDRINLPAGIYKAVVFDSLFCTDTIGTYLVPRFCSRRDTLPFFLAAGTIGTLCLEPPIGISPNNLSFQLLGSSVSGSSAYGTWSLSPQGCLTYLAGATAGYALDTICIAVNVSPPNLNDTICVVVSILSQPPSMETLYFTVQTDQVATSCGIIPPIFNQPIISQLNRPGLVGTSDAFGHYSIDSSSACLTFWANALPGYNVDTILVAACDTALLRCHIIRYVPTVLKPVDCSAGFVPEDNLSAMTSDCQSGSWVCLPIPYGEIGDFAITDNDLPYLNGYLGCNLDTVIAYSISLLPSGGPYQLNAWTVNGQSFSGAFQDANGLVALMNQLDPSPGWMFENNFFIVGGNSSNVYGPIQVTSSQAVVGVLQPNLQYIPRGSQLRFPVGEHQVVLRRIQTGCADTVNINVVCVDCPPIHNYLPDLSGNISWEAASCASDTIFCTSLTETELDDWTITDNGSPIGIFAACDNGHVGFRLDTGFHILHLVNQITSCEYTVPFYLSCPGLVIDDTISIQLGVGQNTLVCPNQSLLAPPITTIGNLCPEGENTSVAYDQQNFCATITGLLPGQDTLCLQICNGNGDCYTTAALVNVIDPTQDTLTEAHPDEAFVLKNESLDIPVLANDILENTVNNIAALSALDIVQGPDHGTAEYDPDSHLVLYTPATDYCGADAFIYRIHDTRGVQDTALVRIQVFCDKLLIFNGFSPNGDQANDYWHILGIEAYPNNTVQVFNRWGNLVFEQRGYTNALAWDGTWNGKALPDGTYYYLIDLGNGGKVRSGYLELVR